MTPGYQFAYAAFVRSSQARLDAAHVGMTFFTLFRDIQRGVAHAP
jgi:hypothetical protein